ncbi:MAG: VCBS repeat-containing protein [Flavobacteriales bacterium]|nr:VCBS repeat-containing protein [Flavobacteriales bacterium]
MLSLIVLLSISFVHCDSANNSDSKERAESISPLKPLFEKRDASHTGIEFFNDIVENKNSNIFKYDYMYNGGGVAIADIDNDGLVDLFFTGNMRNNRLYKNMGDFKFKDITKSANVTASKGSWSTGASFIDINADGYQDIYVCRSFDSGIRGIQRNQLYINNGDLTFTEQAKEYGLDDPGFSTQASYFDYDQDGDIDVFIANHGVDFHRSDPTIRHRKWLDPKMIESNHLYRNNGDNTFTNVTTQAGLLSYDYTLGVITADINGDGLPDIYTSNDYEHPDKYYINNGDGTFKESLKEHFKHTSYFSMGVDFADINNDSHSDLIAVDMVAEDNYRQKTMMGSMNPKQFWESVSKGYHYQYMRNSLQLNNGDGNFSEIGQLAGISKTDWSWSVLLADFDLDGWKDIYIANGFYRDTRNVDYRKYYEKNFGTLRTLSDQQIQEILSKIPRQKITNYYFKNKGGLHFENQSFKAGIKEPSYSNGASYADLDNDGDLDLVINNLADKAFVYQNNSIENGGKNYLGIRLLGEGKNPNGIGAKLTIRNKGKIQTRQHIISRGYQSSVSNVLHFGLGDTDEIEELEVKWSSGKTQIIKKPKTNQVLELKEQDASEFRSSSKEKEAPVFTALLDQGGINYKHEENEYDDYTKEILLPHKMSQMGPKISIGDVNGDQLDDVFIGGAANSSSQIYIQQATGEFVNKTSQSLKSDRAHEDIGSLFFDADGDEDLDLYVVSGGNEFNKNDALLLDRLYINDGAGNFSKSTNLLPKTTISGSCVIAEDYDNDGDLDLFVGGRLIPGQYPFPAKSRILENRDGVFKDVTKAMAPSLETAGMVSTALWSDFDQDGLTDLIITGEWMPIRLFRNTGEKFKETTKEWGLDSTNGWWNVIQECDINKDGKPDYVLGNLGLNYKYKANKTTPFPVYVTDFDSSGTQDIVLGYSNQGTYYPVRGKECTSQQMPKIKTQFSSYEEFGKASLLDIYGGKLDSALHREAFEFSSVILENKSTEFSIRQLPIEAQFSAVQGILVEDFTGDDILDVLLTGNLFVSEVETGRADASNGLLLEGKGNFEFTAVSAEKSGFFTPYDSRDLQLFRNASKEPTIIVSNNNASIQLFKVTKR